MIVQCHRKHLKARRCEATAEECSHAEPHEEMVMQVIIGNGVKREETCRELREKCPRTGEITWCNKVSTKE